MLLIEITYEFQKLNKANKKNFRQKLELYAISMSLGTI